MKTTGSKPHDRDRAGWIGITACLSILVWIAMESNSYAGDKAASIERVSPVGSATYFILHEELSTSEWASELRPCTLPHAREIQNAIEKLNRMAGREQQPELQTRIEHFTITFWSNGKIEESQPKKTTMEDVERIIARLKTEELPDSTREIRIAPPAAIAGASAAGQSGDFPPGEQCHARTNGNDRCNRTAKGATGFCWQHQKAKDSYPLK